MATIALTESDEGGVEEFAGKLFGACLATMELANIELGIRLGLYESLAGAGPVTAAQLAGGARIAERYAREWLEQPRPNDVTDRRGRTGPERRRRERRNGDDRHDDDRGKRRATHPRRGPVRRDGGRPLGHALSDRRRGVR